ncbi:MAG: hypothetical protein ACR2NR_19530 [Solirubrobacteraceae bacterium]
MSTLALDQPGTRRRTAGHPEPSLFEPSGGEPSLDEVLSGAWEGLAVHQHVACPVCGGEMTPDYGAHLRPIGGHCRGCRSQLT